MYLCCGCLQEGNKIFVKNYKPILLASLLRKICEKIIGDDEIINM